LERHLARHTHDGAHRHAQEQAGECGRHGDAADGPSFGTAPAGHGRGSACPRRRSGRCRARRMAADVAEGDLGRLLHDVAQLASEGEPSGPSDTLASMKSTSPPVPVTAKPVTLRGRSCGPPLKVKSGRPSQPRTSSTSTVTGAVRSPPPAWWPPCATAFRPHARGSARRPHGVIRHDGGEGRVGDDDLVAAQRGALELAADQVVPGDGHLLRLGVAVEADDLHAVEQRAGMVSITLAVVMNITWERSRSTSR